jgi:hypothetical protein
LNGETVTLSLHQRLRLELAGVIRDAAGRIKVTDAGRAMARNDVMPIDHEMEQTKLPPARKRN